MNRRAWLAGAGLTLGAAWLDTRLAAAGDAPEILLSLNENPFGPSPRAVEVIRAELSQLARYNTEERTQQLIDVIAAKEQVSRDQVVLGEILEPLGMHLGLQGGQVASSSIRCRDTRHSSMPPCQSAAALSRCRWMPIFAMILPRSRRR